MNETTVTAAEDFVVTFDQRPVWARGALDGLRRMTFADARALLAEAARIPKHGRIVHVTTLATYPLAWVSDDLRSRPGYGVPDEYGRVAPWAVYVRYERGEIVSRNQSLAGAEKMADRYAAEGRPVHVSLDTCG